MQNDHQIPNEKNDDYEIVAAIKSLSTTQKQIILHKIEDIKNISNEAEINSSSEIT